MIRAWSRPLPTMFRAYSKRPLPTNTVIKFVPQQEAWILERMGKFNAILEPGLAILIPVIDQIKYVQTLKEVACEIPTQSAITQDNVTLEIDGVLYYKVVDPYKASYGVEDAQFAVSQLAQTTMRAEIGQLTLDKTLAERALLNTKIVHAMNVAAQSWGINCLRYEIRDIHPPKNVVASMHQQVSAERTKRAQILESEGERQSAINIAEGKKQSAILESEGLKAKQINLAMGESESIRLKGDATAAMINTISNSLGHEMSNQTLSYSIAEKYVEAFSELAKEGNTIIVPSNVSDVAGMATQMLSVYNKVKQAT